MVLDGLLQCGAKCRDVLLAQRSTRSVSPERYLFYYSRRVPINESV